ncbi:larval cuticle protein 1 [Drosophila novamexicana]|uniref:larval cuticle protein 1 n=1 Tax=Drosophila novamexicana TaxID=47314 RepID=UPI0011E5ED33|nr:larval cuticle protein 1 [Drosophila novamexicana]
MFRLCLLWVLCCVVSWSAPAPASGSGSGIEGQQLVPIIKSLAEQKNDGSYFFAYEGADGSYREEVGIVRRSGKHNDDVVDDDDDYDDAELEISGVYRYIDSQGERVEVSYTADKNGFVPLGTNIPKEITETARNAVQSLEVRAGKKS